MGISPISYQNQYAATNTLSNTSSNVRVSKDSIQSSPPSNDGRVSKDNFQSGLSGLNVNYVEYWQKYAANTLYKTNSNQEPFNKTDNQFYTQACDDIYFAGESSGVFYKPDEQMVTRKNKLNPFIGLIQTTYPRYSPELECESNFMIVG